MLLLGWLDPLQQSTAIRVIPGGLGRALGRYEAATLIGGAVGALAGGLTLQLQMPLWVCLAAVLVVLCMVPLTASLYASSPGRQPAATGPVGKSRDPRKEWHKALEHLFVYAVVQALLAVADRSWVLTLVRTGNPLSGIAERGISAHTALYIGVLSGVAS